MRISVDHSLPSGKQLLQTCVSIELSLLYILIANINSLSNSPLCVSLIPPYRGFISLYMSGHSFRLIKWVGAGVVQVHSGLWRFGFQDKYDWQILYRSTLDLGRGVQCSMQLWHNVTQMQGRESWMDQVGSNATIDCRRANVVPFSHSSSIWRWSLCPQLQGPRLSKI